MLGKLLKYDFRAMWKQFSIVWPAALAIALINRFTLPWQGDTSLLGSQADSLLGVVTIMAFVSVLVAMFVTGMIFVIRRFYSGLLGDEGYLMHTLPVHTWLLVLSKLICALAVTVLNAAVSVLAMFLLAPIDWTGLFDLVMWKRLVQGLAEQPGAVLYLVEFCLMVAAGLTLMITMVYLSMALGHLFHRRRVLMSVAAFFVLDIAGNVILSLWDELGLPFLEPGGHLAMWAVTGLMLLPALGMFLATSYLLKRHLNLE